MTAVCGGGTSSAQSGFGATLYMAPAAIGALLNNIPTLWAVPLAGFIGAVTYNLSTFCSSDPPAVPTFTATDVVNLLNPYNPSSFNDAQDKFQQLIGAYAWYQVCKCDSVATPAPPTAPVAPTGMPSINPPAVSPAYPTGQPCQVFNYSGVAHAADGSTTQAKLPTNGATYVTVDFSSDYVHTTFAQFGFDFRWFNAAGTQLGSTVITGATTSGDFRHAEAAAPSGSTQFDVFWSPSGGSLAPDPFPWSAIVQLYCGTTPGGSGPTPTPCPSDPFVLGLLEQILALTTIIQRQAAPFAYVAGSSHSGLSGEGHLSVSDLLGVKVQLDTWGTGVGQESGDPDEFFEAGWITWGNADGSTKREWITHSPFVSLPQLGGQFTRVGYTLRQGVSATITELVRES